MATVPSIDVATAIHKVSLCGRCIGLKTDLAGEPLDDAMMTVQRHITVKLQLAPCEGCQLETLVYRIS